MKRLAFLALYIIAVSGSSFGQTTAKVMSYNLLNYPGSDTITRNPYFRTVISYANPDILLVQEITSQTAVNNFRDYVMNSAVGGYTAGTFIDGPDTDNAIFYKASKFSFISNTPIKTALRDINEFKVRHIGSGDTLRIFTVHLKASSTSTDIAKRAAEVDSLRKYTNSLPYGSNFLVCGDFNIYGSTEAAYSKMLAVTNPYDGHFNDVISMTGTWNNPAYSIYHTQSPRTRSFGGGSNGGMDDRFDMFLMSRSVIQNGGPTYVAGSYLVYGNDGNHYNDSINKQPNTAVPVNVANAIHYASDHIPISISLNFGSLTPLPVSYLNFTVDPIDEGGLLRWMTASEKNNSGFQIERLEPGGQKWNTRGFVQGMVNSSVPRDYTFTDPLIFSGTYYYRLRQIDLDGSSSFSQIRSLNFEKISKQFYSQAFPNPAVNEVTIPYAADTLGTVIIEIYDILGKPVIQYEQQAIVGIQNFIVDLSTLSSGMYHYRIRSGSIHAIDNSFSKLVISKD